MALNTLAGNSKTNKIFYDRVLLDRLLPKLVWVKHGKKKSIPKKEGDTIDFRLMTSFPPVTKPIQSGVTPSGMKFNLENIRATVKQLGDFKIYTDVIDMIGIDPIVTEVLEAQGEQAGESLDIAVRDEVAKGTNVYYVGANSAVAADREHVAGNLSGAVIRRIRQVMARNNVKVYPGARAYLAFIHPDVAYDIMGDDAWKNPNLYAGSEAIFDGEIGKLYGVKFIETTLAPIFPGQAADGKDAYGTIVIGDGAYGVVDIAGKSKPEAIIKPLGSGGTDDPLNQRGSIGWIAWIVAVRLDELCILRVETTASVGDLAGEMAAL